MPNNSDDEFTTSCKERDSCRTYLLTYSQANLQKVPDCRAFSDIALACFSEGSSTSEVVQWATSIEDHADGGKHFHMIVKLNKARRWRPVFENIRRRHAIAVNFSSNNCGYLAGYRYVCKDKDFETVLHCPDHPDLRNAHSPKAKKAFGTFSANSKKRQSSGASSSSTIPKKTRLSNSDIAKFLVENNLKKESEFLAAANRRQSEGLSDIYDFILNKSPKALSDLIQTSWKLHNAPTVVLREQMDRMQVILSTMDGECIPGCNGV